MENNKIYCGDGRKLMAEMPEKTIDLVVTSPPYGVGIDYDSWDDDKEIAEYWKFTREWLRETYRVLKDDGRIALNIPYEINRQKKGGRIYFSAEFWMIMKEIGFGFFGIVDLEEDSPHRSKTTAWGSWMSPSSPYIYNPKECVILAYKKKHKKDIKTWPAINPQTCIDYIWIKGKNVKICSANIFGNALNTDHKGVKCCLDII